MFSLSLCHRSDRWAGLSHENLLQYIHHVRDQSHVQLFVEAPSTSLRDYILEQKEVFQHSGKPIGLDVIQSIALAVVSGLNYLDDYQLLNRNVRSTQIYAIRGARGSQPRFVLNNFYAVNQKVRVLVPNRTSVLHEMRLTMLLAGMEDLREEHGVLR